jgi:hypothetical protein
MQKAMVDGRLVVASSEALAVVTCPACDEEVEKRKRRRGDGQMTWFWRHKVGMGIPCPLRHNPVRG